MAPARARPGPPRVKSPSDDPKLDLPPSRPIPPPMKQQKSFAGGSAAIAAAGAAGAAAAAGAASKQPLLASSEEENEGEESEEEESEEAQMCWSVAFTFLPVILEIVTEFGSAAYEAVRTHAHAGARQAPPLACLRAHVRGVASPYSLGHGVHALSRLSCGAPTKFGGNICA